MLRYLGNQGYQPGLLFIYRNGKLLTRGSFTATVRWELEAGGLQSSLYTTGHSFRIGSTTTTAMAGLPESLIKTLGRWEAVLHTLLSIEQSHPHTITNNLMSGISTLCFHSVCVWADNQCWSLVDDGRFLPVKQGWLLLLLPMVVSTSVL